MQLPDFISKMLGFAAKAESHFTASESLTLANAKIVALESEIVTLKAASADFDSKLTALTGERDTAKASLVAKETEVTTLKAELVTAKGTANAVIASQGLAAENLPPLAPRTDGSPDPKTLSMTEQCLAARAKETTRN